MLPLFPPIGKAMMRAFGLTLRPNFTGCPRALEMVESGEPFVIVFYHGRQFLLVQHLRDWPAAIMTSISYMGEIQSRILASYGFRIIRGSSSRGGVRVLAEMISLVRKGKIGAFAVDGPRGPYREIKPGAVYVAKKLGIPVVPASSSAWPSRVLRSTWDHYLLPMPFSKCTVCFGEPLLFDSDLSDDSLKRACQIIGDVLGDLEAKADAFTGRARG